MLADLEQLTGQQATRLLGRVPFSRAQVESYLRLDAGWLEQLALQGSRVMERRHPAEAQRVGDFLARFVVEGLPIGALPAVSLYQEGEGFLPLFDGDEGERIMVVCPTCNNEFILGSTAGFRLLYAEDVPDDATETRGLVWYCGGSVQCPVAKFGERCQAKAAPWRPQPVRILRGAP